MKNEVIEVYNSCVEYLNYINEVGNECAYTDSLIEEILFKSTKLQEAYDNTFNNNNQDTERR